MRNFNFYLDKITQKLIKISRLDLLTRLGRLQVRSSSWLANRLISKPLSKSLLIYSCSEASYSSDDSDVDFNDSFDSGEVKKAKEKSKAVKVEIDLSLSAYGNVQKYYSKKRQAAHKEQKTVDASTKVGCNEYVLVGKGEPLWIEN